LFNNFWKYEMRTFFRIVKTIFSRIVLWIWNIFKSVFSLHGLYTPADKKSTILLLLAPLIIITWRYYGSRWLYLSHFAEYFSFFGSAAMTSEWYTYINAFVLLGVSSIVIIKFLFKEKTADYGFQLGDYKFWIPTLLAICVVMVGAGYLASHSPRFIEEYPLYKGAGTSIGSFLVHAAAYSLLFIGWEMFFRGLLQHGLTGRFGAWGAILVQASLSCILNIGKPTEEIYMSIVASIFWGVLVYRSRSIVPAIVARWVFGVALDFFICFGWS
jgi:membrane protease YdiL (CAAX protease family)